MRRKISQIGPATLMVSLPSKWVKQHNVKKGDEIELEEKNKQLVLTLGNYEPEVQSTEIDIKDLEPFVFRALAATYKSGYDEVSLVFDDPAQIKRLHPQINELLPGFEIIEHSRKKCRVKSISTASEKEFDNVLRRAFLVTLSLADNCLSAVKEKNTEKLDEVLILEKTNNKLCNFCERLLHKKGYKNDKKTMFVYNVVWELEKVADEYKYLAIFLSNRKNFSFSKETMDMFQEANSVLEMFYRTFYSPDLRQVAEITKKRKAIITNFENLIEKRQGNEARVLHHLVNITQKAFDMLGCAFGVWY